MSALMEKLFKGFTLKEIEEIVLTSGNFKLAAVRKPGHTKKSIKRKVTQN